MAIVVSESWCGRYVLLVGMRYALGHFQSSLTYKYSLVKKSAGLCICFYSSDAFTCSWWILKISSKLKTLAIVPCVPIRVAIFLESCNISTPNLIMHIWGPNEDQYAGVKCISPELFSATRARTSPRMAYGNN